MARRKRRSGLPIILFLLILLLGVIAAGAFWYINGNKLMLPGEWSREIDITDQVLNEATSYIETAAFGDEVNMSDYIADIKLDSMLTVTKDGEIKEMLSEEQYNQQTAMCNEGLENAIRDLIARRIKDNYIDTDMSVDELIQETFGMSLSGYLESYGPKLMPDYSELSYEYGMSGYYEATKDGINIQYTDGNSVTCNYAVSHGMLVIDYSDGAVVYYER